MRAFVFFIATFLISTSVFAGDTQERWGYTGQGKALHWGNLHQDYHACKAGKAQSPVNIEQYLPGEQVPLNISYGSTPLHVVNNGHTIKVNYAPGSSVSISGKTFNLLQFHFHTPSEHYVDGSPYPMEVHFVHRAEDGALAVIGALMKVGEHNRVIEGIWQNAPINKGQKKIDSVELSAFELLPSDLKYYKYEGSLTTPPCSEGVQWHILTEPIELSEDQLRTFQSIFPVNARPVQPMHGRVITGF